MKFYIATVTEKGGRIFKRQITTDREDITQAMIIQSVMILHNPDAVESVSAQEYKPQMGPPINLRPRN